MTTEWIGLMVLVVGLGMIIALVIWSRASINRISRRRLGRVRDIVQDRHHGREA